MTSEYVQDLDEESARRRLTTGSAPDPVGADGAMPGYADGIRSLQQTHGNRAVRRLLQRANSSSSSTSPDDDLAHRIETHAGGGNSLDSHAQRKLEDGLGADLSGVRVHTDSEADKMARSVDSVAFTSGQDIFFSEGAYDPSSHAGMRLLAHEATHTVQQGAGPVAGAPSAGGVSISDPSDEYERAAELTAERIVSGMPTGHAAAPPGGATVQVQRETKLQDDEEQTSLRRPDEGSTGEAVRPAVRLLDPSEYVVAPVTEGKYAGQVRLIDRNTQDEWLFKPYADEEARAIDIDAISQIKPNAQSKEPHTRAELAELNGQRGVLKEWTRAGDTLAHMMERDNLFHSEVYADIMKSELKNDFQLIAPLVKPLESNPENLKVSIDPSTGEISKAEAVDIDAAFPPGPLRDSVLAFLQKDAGAQQPLSQGTLADLQRLVVNKEPLRRVMEVFFGEDIASAVLLRLDAVLAEAAEESERSRK
jgi:hypothetical protein